MNEHYYYPVSRIGLFALFNLFRTEASIEVRNLLRATIQGDELTTIQMISQYPILLRERGNITKGITKDYSGRQYSNVTAFQLALCLGDQQMAIQMRDIFLKSSPDDGQNILAEQFNELFPNGYLAHIQMQKNHAKDFLANTLNPLIDAFDNASLDDLRAVSNLNTSNSKLGEQLNLFRQSFKELSMHELIYNPFHLLSAFEIYNNKYDAWCVADDEQYRTLRLDLFWRLVIGWEQRYMPTNLAQYFCDGLNNHTQAHQPLKRTLNVHHDETNQDSDFFPLDVDANRKLGTEIAVYSTSRAVAAIEQPNRLIARTLPISLAALITANNSKISALFEPNRWQPCLIL